MNLYLESSAVISWLFEEPDGKRVGEIIADAVALSSSDLTLLECERAIIRALTVGTVSDGMAARLRAQLAEASSLWGISALDPGIMRRAAQPFPSEPLRTLDALHAAFVLQLHARDPNTAILALDQRIRKVCLGLGLPVQPD